LFALEGWDHDQALTAIDIVLRKLADAGSRGKAYEQLRKEQRWRLIAGLPAASWTALLRILLGSPSKTQVYTNLGMGVLVRLAVGETIHDLASDPLLVASITRAAPKTGKTQPGFQETKSHSRSDQCSNSSAEVSRVGV
jgi:hypothetical protein